MSESINRFIPVGDIRDSHEIIVDAPASVVFEAAAHFDIESVHAVRAIAWFRAKILGAPHSPMHGGLFEAMKQLGWVPLASTERRELVMGAVAKVAGELKIEAISTDGFLSAAGPDTVKMAWSVQAEPMTETITRLRTQTRVMACDGEARREFAAYWRRFSPGVPLIRRLLLRAVKREAERQFKAQATRLTSAATHAH